MKKLLAILLTLTLLTGLLAGCGSSSAETESSEDESTAVTQADAEETDTEESPTEESESEAEENTSSSGSALPDTYPLLCDDGSVTLTLFQVLVPDMTDIDDYNDLYFWQEVTNRTGISLNWNLASFTSAETQFNLLVSAGDLPNIVCVTQYYTAGITSAVENDVFVDLSDYLEEYAPDYLEVISQDDVYPAISDDNGSIIAFYEIGMEEFSPNNGVFIRGDLLEEQGLDVPVTYDEYEETMLALKTAYDIEAPVFYTFENTQDQWLSSGQYVKSDFSLDEDGNCIYGPVEDGYREYLKILNRWYEEGLIYQEFYQTGGTSGDDMDEYISTGKSILGFAWCEDAGTIELPEGGYLVAGYIPRNNEDDEIHLTEGINDKVNYVSWGIGTNSTEEEIQYACMLLNYFYTEEGSLLANYGVEGVTFEYLDDGTPWYTDLITDNPDGLTQTLAMYTYIGYSIPALSDYTKYNVAALTDWADFIEVWGSSADNSWDMPAVSLSIEEQEEYSAVATDVETYLDENVAKFIIGDLDVNDDAVWQNYLDDLESLGVNTMIEIYSAALERYNAR